MFVDGVLRQGCSSVSGKGVCGLNIKGQIIYGWRLEGWGRW